MSNIKRFVTLWILFFLFNLVVSMDDGDNWSDYGDNCSDWGSDEEINVPDCVPNFFMKAEEICKCVGTPKEVEVGQSYCFPPTYKFKVNINGKLKKIATPIKYQENLVQNEELKNCIPNEETGVSDVCFCGTEQDKEKMKNSQKEEEELVNLNHICIPLLENEKMDFLSASEELPHYKSPYCYENQCQRHSKNFTEENQFINKVQKIRKNWMKRLNDAANAKEIDIEKIKLILNEQEKTQNKETSTTSQEQKNDARQRTIKWLTAENYKKTPLHYAAKRLYIHASLRFQNRGSYKEVEESTHPLEPSMGIIRELFEFFGENNEKLIEFVMKKDEKGKTAFMDAIVTPHSLDLYKKDQKGMQLKEELLTLLMSPFYIKEKKRQDYFTEIDENPMLMEPNRLMRKQDALKDIVFGPINQQCGEEKEKLIQFMMDEENSKQTSLHLATNSILHSTYILQFLLHLFKPEIDTLIEVLIKSDKTKKTVFHLAVENYNELTTIKVESFLKIFRKTNKNEKLFECLIKGNEDEDTVLHIALRTKQSQIVELLTKDIILRKQNQQIVDLFLKKNKNNVNILQQAEEVLNSHFEDEKEKHINHHVHGNLRRLPISRCGYYGKCSCIQNEYVLTKIFQNAKLSIERDFQLLSKEFKSKSVQEKNECSPIMSLFGKEFLSNIILKYLVGESDQNLHSNIQEDKVN